MAATGTGLDMALFSGKYGGDKVQPAPPELYSVSGPRMVWRLCMDDTVPELLAHFCNLGSHDA